jgi:hypothetical protein
MLLIHCGDRLGQGRSPLRGNGLSRLLRHRNEAAIVNGTSGRSSNQDLPAQSSGLAIWSSGGPKWEIPNGLGSEFLIFETPQKIT